MNIRALAQRYASAGWRHRWAALALAWLICVPGWIAVYMLPSQYQANARIYADPEALLGTLLRGLAVDSSPAQQVEMLQRTLLARPNLERVIARTDLDQRVHDIQSRERLIADLGRSIKITPQTRQLFRIEYTDSDPRLAHAVVQTVVTLFLEAAASNDRQQLATARTFLSQQIAAYEAQLRQAETRRAEFMAKYVDILPSAQLGGATRLEASRQRLADLKGQLQDATLRRDSLRQQLEATPQTLAQARAQQAGGNPQLVEAERQLRELLLRYTDQHPAVQQQRSIIAELRRTGGTAPRPQPPPMSQTPAAGGPPNPVYEQIRLRLVDQDAAIASLERRVRDAEAQVEQLDRLARTAPHVAAELQNLDRDYDILLRNYRELLERRESLQIATSARQDSDRMRIEVVDPPVVPVVPTGPKRELFAAGVLVAGLGAGAVLVFLLIQLDRGFYTIHDLRGLGLPVLGGISSAVPRPSRIGSAIVFSGGLAALLLVFSAMLTRGTTIVARMPDIVARLVT